MTTHTPDPFTPADVAAVIQAARVLGRGGAGPLPKLSEDLSKIANKIGDAVPHAVEPEKPLDRLFNDMFPTDRAEAEGDL